MTSTKRKRTLQAFIEGDESKLWSVTKELFDSGFFNCYLTPQQFNLLETLLQSDISTKGNNLLWKSFLRGSLILKFKEDKGDDANSNENMYMKPGYPTLRNLNATIRYLLYEKAIDYYYSGNKNTYIDEFQLLENTLDLSDENITDHIESSEPQPKYASKDDDEDDDYDDDDAEEGGDGKINGSKSSDAEPVDNKLQDSSAESQETILTYDNATNDPVLMVSKEELLKKPDYPSAEEISQNEEEIGKLVHPILGTSSAIESNQEKQNEIKLIKTFSKTFHNFENDLPNMIKRRKLERSNKQVDELPEVQTKDHEEENDSKQVDKLISLGGAANLSLKNLLRKIETNREKLGVTDVELKNLIMDVRKNRSKWANYNRIGQEELYEACEKVVTELRGYTEHSTPFLNKVSKREAPNYYQVIKTPMDLNTVLKKLKTLHYNNKKEFVDDIMLIWQNCLTYNSDPKHFLRTDAIAMRKKSLTLIPLIPDITIRDRTEVEREAAELEMKEKETEDNTEVGRTSARGMGNKTTRKTRKGTNVSDTEITEKEEIDSNAATVDQEGSDFEMMDTSVVNDTEKEKSEAPLGTVEEEPANGDDVDEEEEDEEAEEEDRQINNFNQTAADEDANEDTDDLEMSTWKTLTSNTRFKLCNERSKLFKDNQIGPESHAILRNKTQMHNFSWYLEDESNIVLHKNRKYFDENDDPYLIEYDVTGGIPSTGHKNIDFDKLEDNILEDMIEKGQKLEDLPESSLKVKLQGSNSLIMDNISLMQDVRKVCFKINMIRTMQTSQFIHQSQFVAPTYPKVRFDDIDPMSKLGTRDIMTDSIANQSLKKSVAALAMLNGFEKTTPSCAVVLTEVAKKYIINLAKTFKLQLESKSVNKLETPNSKPLTCRELLKIVLRYNGLENPDAMYSYYKEQLTKQQQKLMDLKFGLENFLCDLLRPSMQEISETQFNDDSEQFVNGDFSDEIGEDFFGFKELGLDKEFGLLTSNIPLHLLQSKLSHQFSQMSKNMSKRVYPEFENYVFPKLKKKDIPNQLPILQPFYNELLEKTRLSYNRQLKRYQTQIANGETPEEPFEEVKDEEELVLLEDDDLPLKQRNNRPKIPPNGRITQAKKKSNVATFYIEQQVEMEGKMESILASLNAQKEHPTTDNHSDEHVLETNTDVTQLSKTDSVEDAQTHSGDANAEVDNEVEGITVANNADSNSQVATLSDEVTSEENLSNTAVVSKSLETDESEAKIVVDEV